MEYPIFIWLFSYFVTIELSFSLILKVVLRIFSPLCHVKIWFPTEIICINKSYRVVPIQLVWYLRIIGHFDTTCWLQVLADCWHFVCNLMIVGHFVTCWLLARLFDSCCIAFIFWRRLVLSHFYVLFARNLQSF